MVRIVEPEINKCAEIIKRMKGGPYIAKSIGGNHYWIYRKRRFWFSKYVAHLLSGSVGDVALFTREVNREEMLALANEIERELHLQVDLFIRD